MSSSVRLLVVEDSVEDTFFIVRELQRGGFVVDFERVETQEAMADALRKREWDVIICDYSMPLFGGNAALALYNQCRLDIPFIIVSGVLPEDVAVELFKRGAHDFIKKSNLSELVPAVQRELEAVRERRARRQSEAMTAYLASIVRSCDDAIVGVSPEGNIVSWNAAAQALFRYSPVEVIGRPFATLLPGSRVMGARGIFDRVKSGERADRVEIVCCKKDGAAVELSLTISPVRDAEDRVIGASVVARDITRRKQEENERLALIQELTTALSQAQA